MRVELPLKPQLCASYACMVCLAASDFHPYSTAIHVLPGFCYKHINARLNCSVIWTQSDAAVVELLGTPLDVKAVEEHSETFAPWKRLVLQLRGPRDCTHVSSCLIIWLLCNKRLELHCKGKAHLTDAGSLLPRPLLANVAGLCLRPPRRLQRGRPH